MNTKNHKVIQKPQKIQPPTKKIFLAKIVFILLIIGIILCIGLFLTGQLTNFFSTRNTPKNEDTVEFIKEDYGTQEDCITKNVCIARAERGGLYNSVNESKYSYGSPSDTEWYFGSYCKNDLNFKDWSLASYDNPEGSIGRPGCLHLISDDLYYNVMFKSWTKCNGESNPGGGFAYTRTRTSPIIWTN